MVFGIYVMRDIKNEFLAPTYDSNDASAIRSFDTMIRRTNDVLHFHPEDFELYKIGSYDSENASINMLDVRELIAEGRNFKDEK